MTRIEIWQDLVRPVNDRERHLLRNVQLVLRVPTTGEMDDQTIAAIRGAQILFGLKPYDKFMQLRWVEQDEDE